MKERYLRIKVAIIHLLIRAKILKNVWHKAELDLAELEANKLMKFFGWDD